MGSGCVRPGTRAQRWLIVLLLGAVACGNSIDSPSTSVPTASTGPNPTATSSVASVQQEVIAAYQRFWEVWLEANNPPNPDYPPLIRATTGTQQDLVRRNIAENAASYSTFRNRSSSIRSHKIVVVDATSARVVLEDCNVDDGLVLDSRTLSVINDVVSTHLWRATLMKVGDEWKLADNQQLRKWAGSSDCMRWQSSPP